MPIVIWEQHDNKNDVIITCKLFYKVLPDLKLREDIQKVYNVDVLSESDTGMAKKILNKQYAESSGSQYRDFKELRTHHDSVEVSDILDDNFDFKHKELDDLLERLKKRKFSVEEIEEDEEKSKFQELVKIGKLTHKVAKGGLHSQNTGVIYTNEECELLDIDVSSFYPTLLLNLELSPAHLDKRSFLKTVYQITTDRLKAKATGDKVKANALKISINSIYGLLKMAYYWLYDPKVLYSVTINGQLYLLELVSKLEFNGIEVIYSNTDGITSKVYPHQKDLYYQICEEWRTKFKFEVEYTKFEKMILRDVNNFLIIKENGEKKPKGCFVTEISLKTGFEYPIVPLALENYFIRGIPVDETIVNHTDIYDYCISQKSDDKFKNEFHQIVNGEYQVSDVQKTLRYFVSTDGGSLFKVPKSLEIEREKSRNQAFQFELVPKDLEPKKKVTERIAYEQGSKITLFNDYFEGDYKVNYQYYINEAKKMIDVIEKDTKMSLFL